MVRVTLPVHPLSGACLPLLRNRHGPVRKHVLEVLHPSGRVVLLPVAWTERAPPVASTRGPDGQLLRLDIDRLRALAVSVERLRAALDADPGPAPVLDGADHGEPLSSPSAAVAGAPAAPADRTGRGLGRSGAGGGQRGGTP